MYENDHKSVIFMRFLKEVTLDIRVYKVIIEL